MTGLRGSLQTIGLERVLQLMADIHASGRLRVANEELTGELTVESGRVVGATFDRERGLDALSAIALCLSEAEFELLPPETRADLNIALAADELLAYLGRVALEREELAQAVPSIMAVPRREAFDAHHDLPNQVMLNRDSLQILLAIDGQRTVAALAGELGLHRTLRAISGLVAAGLITTQAVVAVPIERDPPPIGKPEPVADPESSLIRRVRDLFVVRQATGAAPAPRPQRSPMRSAAWQRPPPGGIFAGLGWVAYRQRWAIVAAGLALVLAGVSYGAGVTGSLKTGGYTDPASESSLADDTLRRQLGRDQGTVVALFSSHDELTVDQPEFQAAVESALARIEGQPGVGHIETYYTTAAEQFVSTDRHATYASIGLLGGDAAQLEQVRSLRPMLTSDRLQVRLGGWPAISDELTDQVTDDLQKAELSTFPIVAVLLMLIFGSVVASFLPLTVAGVSILGSFVVLRLIAGYTDVSLLALNIITMFGLGLAIDYSLLVVSRFREEMLRSEGDVPLALVRTLRTAGRTVFFSGLTVVISLLSLDVFAPMFLRSLGLGGATAVMIAMLAALTVLPAMLAILGPRVDLLSIKIPLRRPSGGHPQEPHGFWHRTSSLVMRHPGTVLLLTVAPLIWLGLPFLRITFGLPDANSLPEHHDSRQVADILQRDFPANETQPILIVIRSAGSALEPVNLNALYDYSRQIAALPHVRRVDDLVTADPQLDKADYAAFYSASGRAQNVRSAELAKRFANGNYSLMSVVYDGDPYSPAIQDLVKEIRHITPPRGLTAQVTGWPTYLVDLLASLGHSLPAAVGLIVGVMFVLLFLMLGSVVVPLKAVLLNVLSLSVSFGTLVWIFQDGHLANWLGFTPVGNIDTTQPVIIFAAAFGLSMDYEVFLLSRIKEQYDRTGDMWSAVTTGIQKTGGIVTSAALLLVVVFLSFVQGEVLFIKQVGLGLAVAILVDATVVRMLLLPATMRLLGTYNWWAPAPLGALHRRLGLGEHEIEPDVHSVDNSRTPQVPERAMC